MSMEKMQRLLSNLLPSDLSEIGLEVWQDRMSCIQKANIEAALQAQRGEQGVGAEPLKHQLGLVVHEVLVLELWRRQLLPRIIERASDNGSGNTITSAMPVYSVLFNEAVCVNLLETSLFGSCDGLDDEAVDLVDYCVRQITDNLVNVDKSDDDDSDATDLSVLQQIERHRRSLGFQIGLRCISLLTYMADHVSSLPLSVAHRLVVSHDVPVLAATLITLKPWSATSKTSNTSILSRPGFQCWLLLYQLLSKPEMANKYVMNEYRRNLISGLFDELEGCQHFFDEHKDFFEHFKRHLLHLKMAVLPQPRPQLLMETVAALTTCLNTKYDASALGLLAEEQLERLKSASPSLHSHLSNLVSSLEHSYHELSDPGLDILEKKERSSCTCSQCGGEGERKRCSRCKKVFYCSKQCQSQHWPIHKLECTPIL